VGEFPTAMKGNDKSPSCKKTAGADFSGTSANLIGTEMQSGVGSGGIERESVDKHPPSNKAAVEHLNNTNHCKDREDNDGNRRQSVMNITSSVINYAKRSSLFHLGYPLFTEGGHHKHDQTATEQDHAAADGSPRSAGSSQHQTGISRASAFLRESLQKFHGIEAHLMHPDHKAHHRNSEHDAFHLLGSIKYRKDSRGSHHGSQPESSKLSGYFASRKGIEFSRKFSGLFRPAVDDNTEEDVIDTVYLTESEQQLLKILRSPIAMGFILAYCESEHNSEYLKFLYAVEELRVTSDTILHVDTMTWRPIDREIFRVRDWNLSIDDSVNRASFDEKDIPNSGTKTPSQHNSKVVRIMNRFLNEDDVRYRPEIPSIASTERDHEHYPDDDSPAALIAATVRMLSILDVGRTVRQPKSVPQTPRGGETNRSTAAAAPFTRAMLWFCQSALRRIRDYDCRTTKNTVWMRLVRHS
jgi:hypothetical protein